MDKKICKGCQKLLPINSFNKSKNVKDGYENKCKKCRRKSRRKHINKCVVCGEMFKTASKTTKTCSPKCQGVLRRTRINTECSYCGSSIEVLKSRFKRHEYNYCNQECRSKHLKVLMVKDGNPNYKRHERDCDGCGTTIEVIPSEMSRGLKFCGYECYKNNIGRFYEGENNNYYNHNLTNEERLETRRYKAYYNWRENVFKRDRYTCQKCRDSTGGNLNAHHIYSYNTHKTLRTTLSNGITLCNECHKGFHDNYGYGDNTLQQIEEYMNQTLIL